jgi:hypothetical protein
MHQLKLCGVAAAVVVALLAVPAEIAVVPASAAPLSKSIASPPREDPAPDCAPGAANPACEPAPPPDPAPPYRRHGSPVIVGPPLAPFSPPAFTR